MIILNFSHPLTEQQRLQIETLAGVAILEIRNIPVHIRQEDDLEPQCREIISQLGFSVEEWQQLPLVINPPGYAPVTAVLLVIIHGLSGQFPGMVRIRPVAHTAITTYEVVELVNLQQLRERARQQRRS